MLLDRKWMQIEIVTNSSRGLSIIYKLFDKNYFGSNEQKSRYHDTLSFTSLAVLPDLVVMTIYFLNNNNKKNSF